MPFPQSRRARRLLAGLCLIAMPVAIVIAARGIQQPWIPSAPAYRQEGPANAKVVLVEYSDFECPACGAAVAPVKMIREHYGENIRVIFKQFPWDFHPYAKKAAIAAECAGQQGKFWPMHDLLFKNQRSWPEAPPPGTIESAEQKAFRESKADGMILGFAKDADISMMQFEACRNDPATAAAVEADVKEGKDHWVHSTPTFFINGTRFVGAPQLRTIGMNEIDRVLKKS